ncbi:hypothetical protein PMZ80_010740 [Knufia obscura]|uniref:F-box domain-containing protein n=1 Tax=Knufia obscura TaxID=1635080 RepID=A0ABR0R8M5_9EURO|nr:hypothetical protein PMZ80_010740 [Knufia obscura]
MSEFIAMPTLMGIPTELRLRIFEFVHQNESGYTIRINANNGQHRLRYWYAFHPLLATSRQIRVEASEKFRIKLAIDRDEGHNIDGADNFKKTLCDFHLRSVSRIVLDSINGFNIKYINKEQFPNLESVTVETVMLSRDGQPMTWTMALWDESLDNFVRCDGNPPSDVATIKNGRYNTEMARAAKLVAQQNSIVDSKDLLSLQERGFVLFCRAYVIVSLETSMHEVVSETGCRDVVDANVFVQKIVYNYDRLEVVEKEDLNGWGEDWTD